MVTEFINGGELFTILRNHGPFNHQRVTYYAAEIVVALECCHSRGLLYRDLKTENILFNADGHIKLIDFGVSKGNLNPEIKGRSKTLIHGTLEYLAPEVVRKEGEYGFEIDWYALGLVIYEMLTGGEHPFKIGNPDSETYTKDVCTKIKEGNVPMKFFSAVEENLLKSLLHLDPN